MQKIFANLYNGHKLISHWLAFFLIVFGVRLIVCNHYAADIPFMDEWEMADQLREMRDHPALASQLFKVHVQHIIAFTRLEQLIVVKFNGLWQSRVANLFHAFVYTCFALAVTLGVHKALRGRNWFIFIAGLVTFSIPWAGDKMLWPLLSCFSWMMLWIVLLCWTLALVDRLPLKLVLSLGICVLAFVSMGPGALAPVLGGAWFFYLLLKDSPVNRRFHLLAVGLHFALFLVFYRLIPKEGGQGLASDLWTTLKAFLRCLAYPTVNVWVLGLLSFFPWAVLLGQLLLRKEKAAKSEALLLLLGSAVVLQSMAIAAFRGDNGNGGVPASRYYDALMFGPLVNLGILLFLFDKYPTSRKSPGIVASFWGLATISGFMLVLMWRTLPWLSLDSGEWEYGLKQSSLAAWARGEVGSVPSFADPKAPEVIYVGNVENAIEKVVSLSNAREALIPAAMIGGYPLRAAPESDGFELNGYPNNRLPRPWLRYWGSYDRSGGADHPRKFESQALELNCTHLQFDFLFDKKSRFRFYNLGQSSLKLVRLSDGFEVNILKALPRAFPSIFTDRETLTVRVPEPGLYKIVAEDLEVDGGWFAFSEPTASGPLGAVAQIILNSGKLALFLGVLLAALVALVEFITKNSTQHKQLI